MPKYPDWINNTLLFQSRRYIINHHLIEIHVILDSESVLKKSYEKCLQKSFVLGSVLMIAIAGLAINTDLKVLQCWGCFWSWIIWGFWWIVLVPARVSVSDHHLVRSDLHWSWWYMGKTSFWVNSLTVHQKAMWWENWHWLDDQVLICAITG